MKTLLTLCLAALTTASLGQAPGKILDPMTSLSKQDYLRKAKLVLAAAEEMPAEKYGYRPKAKQWSFGEIVAYDAASYSRTCAMYTDQRAAAATHIGSTASKLELVVALKTTFDFCNRAMSYLQNSVLGDHHIMDGNRMPRAAALIYDLDDQDNHYSQMVSYLRHNGLTPPSGK